jgi:hypothetical protein
VQQILMPVHCRTMPSLYHRARLPVITFQAIKPTSSAYLKIPRFRAVYPITLSAIGTNCSARRCAGRP